MLAPVVLLTLIAAPFPLPGIDGKPLATTEGQKTFRLPMRFEKVKAFYEERFKDQKGVTVRAGGMAGARSLVLETSRTADAWKSATIHERELETVVELKPVLRMDETAIDGKGPPVEFIFTRSPEVQRSLETIDHTEQLKAR